MVRTIAISDIHGCFMPFISLLEKVNYNKYNDRLVVLGDLVDRGTDSMQVVQFLMQMSASYDVKVIGGNHDDFFIQWLDSPEAIPEYLGMNIGGLATLKSFYGKSNIRDLEKVRQFILRNYEAEIAFLKNLPDFVEGEHFNFVHAGINPDLLDWRNSDPYYFRRDRKIFLNRPHECPKTFVFGHTNTRRLHGDPDNNGIWVGERKIGIDGGCVSGGQLNALIMEGENYTVDFVTMKEGSFSV